MISIKKATIKEVTDLALVGKKAFIIPHKDAIPSKIMVNYLNHSFSEKTLLEEITNPNYQYNLIFVDDNLAGFSKIIFNHKNDNITQTNVTKMERLYLLEEYYGLGLGNKLFQHNLHLAKEQNQNGIWLYVWIKNFRALEFYKKVGFKKIAMYDFPISETEKRPNDVLYLKF
ncbi:GNAT family N-acetyltransferase [Polaribacter aestuariivivens]|uniref:GNAT family N-acetyltransferase n=1 Tax=Polaribacter aestuariivivens TaxID=2304626 RepID=A0A5S3N9V8_9FLAO|nr:GNAT family N-acetyltransferase [Polaribacter aestuariivivens]TMM32015.1 GNAT family N-acetyltransferase [Polaribacter aestuariivivens]